MNWKQTLSLFIALFFGINAHADNVQTINTIEQAAYEFSLAKAQESFDNPQVVLGNLDSDYDYSRVILSLRYLAKVNQVGLVRRP